MPVISVVTCVLPAKSQWLEATWKSLVAQHMPPDWSWQWLVQVDGPGGLAWEPPVDDRVSLVANSRDRGPAISRTLTLGRAAGELVRVLDADDQLTDGALARDVDAFAENPAIGWVTSRALDLLPDGTTIDVDAGLAAGPVVRGAVADYWLAHDHRLPVHPATLCARLDLVLALGGWLALPTSEDTGLLLALDAVAAGSFIEEPGLLYRKWPAQLTAGSGHNDSAERAARISVIEARVRSLAKWSVEWPGVR